jgi:hypothetical protein
MHPYIHAYMHAYIHTYININIYRPTNIYRYIYAVVPPLALYRICMRP